MSETVTWRPMRAEDVPGVMALSEVVHPGYYERPEVFLDRLRLFPEGALVAEAPGGVETANAGPLAAYALAYPAPLGAPPPLDVVLGALSPGADALYVHDVAVDPALRGRRVANGAIGRLLALADARFEAAMLVSVYGTGPFWARFGFAPAHERLVPGALGSFGEDAVFMVRRGG